MRVVVTGGAGFIGSHLCRALLERGDEVVCIDNLVTGRLDNIAELFENERFRFQNHDVSSYVHVSGDVDAVLHFASPASPADFGRIPIQILKVGSLGTHHLLGLAKDKGARFLLASTSEVYGDPLVHPQPETYWGNVNPIGPRGVYDEAKRFAEAMTMAYHRHHNVDVRIVRIFNSVLADEKVLFHDGRELRYETAAEASLHLASLADGEIGVPAFDGEGGIRPTAATALIAHPPTGRCFEVRTRYGRSVRVTADHSVFVEGRDGRPVARFVSELTRNDRVAIAGRIAVPESDRGEVRFAEIWDAAGEDPWDLIVRAPRLGRLLWQRRHELQRVIMASQRSEAVDKSRAAWRLVKQCIDNNQIPLAALRMLGVPILPTSVVKTRTQNRGAQPPETVLITDELLWVLGFFLAEGCRQLAPPKTYALSFSSDSYLLERAAKILEDQLNATVVFVPPTPGRAPQIALNSRLLVALFDHLGFGPGAKGIPGWILALPLNRLKWFLEGYREGDGVHSGVKLDEGIRHEFSTTSERLKDELVVAFGRFGLIPSIGRYNSTIKAKTGDRTYPFWRLTLANVAPWDMLQWDKGVVQRLNARRYGDLVWAAVTDVVEVEPTELVYDFCVPGRENFLAGSGVMVHNTFGPRMRTDDGRVVTNLLVQALRDEPLTIYGDGTQTRSFCYVDDEVRGILALLDSDYIGPINIGNPNEFTILEFAERVLEVTGSDSKIEYQPLPVDDPMQRKPDITLAKKHLGWEPAIDLVDGLRRTAAYFRTQLA